MLEELRRRHTNKALIGWQSKNKSYTKRRRCGALRRNLFFGTRAIISKFTHKEATTEKSGE